LNTLAGRIAVITGSSRGLGRAMADAFAEAGATVVVAARSPSAVADAVADLRAAGHVASGLACDVADLAQVRALADHAVAQHGHFDVWVNNAGIAGPYGPTMDLAPERFVGVLQTNVLGTYHGSMTALDHFLARGSGKLVNVLGRGDRDLSPFQNAYASSKAWVRAFTLTLAKEYADSGVGIFAFNPGLVDTDLLRKVEVVTGHEHRLAAFPTVIRMWANPPAVPAAKAVWLASSATDGRTGLEVRVLGTPRLVRGAAGEGWRRLARRPGRPVDIALTPVPPAGRERD
jgi:glucose 1-dehydrogenase